MRMPEIPFIRYSSKNGIGQNVSDYNLYVEQKTGLCRSDIKEGRDHRETADDLHNGVQPGVFYSAFPVLGHDLFADDH